MTRSAKTEFSIRKTQWIEALASDPDVDNTTMRICVLIAKYMNRETGDTFVGRGTIARFLPVTRKLSSRAEPSRAERNRLKTVDRCVAYAEALGYLAVDRRPGRSHSNTYEMRFPIKAACMPPLSTELAACMPPITEQEKATSGGQKGDIELQKRRPVCRPNLITNLDSTQRPSPTTPTASAATPRAFQGSRSPAAKQNKFHQIELNRLAEFASHARGISLAQGWELLLGLDEKRIDYLKRKLRRCELGVHDLPATAAADRLVSKLRAFDE